MWLLAALAVILLFCGIHGDLKQATAIPNQPDAFYHATRILTTVENLANFYQFDTNIHAPDGSWLTWPWAFDFFIACLVKLINGIFNKALSIDTNPEFILFAIIPILFYIANIYLVLAITRALNLTKLNQFFAGIAFIGLPINTFIHQIGRIDHHFAELFLVLATLLNGILLFKTPSKKSAISLGIILGAAPAFQCGLFILQLPLLLTILIINYKNKYNLIQYYLNYYVSSLIITTLLFLLGSLPFWHGKFSFYLFSWFHLYIAIISSIAIYFISYYKVNYYKTNYYSKYSHFVILLLILSIPTWGQLYTSLGFLFNKLSCLTLKKTAEMQPAINYYQHYTDLIFIFPLLLLYLLITSIKQNNLQLIYTSIFLSFGAVLLFCQYRLNYFGSLALFLPLLILVNNLGNLKINYLFILLLLFLLYPANKKILNKYNTPWIIADDAIYQLYLPVIPKLAKICQHNPGIILAETHLGHYLRYHTNCAVMANRMLITPLHFAKANRANQLLAGDINHLLQAHEPIKYILLDTLTHKYESNLDYPVDSIAYQLLFTNADLYSNHLRLLFQYNGNLDQIRMYQLK